MNEEDEWRRLQMALLADKGAPLQEAPLQE
jgi:hypothetical protein